jgi:hypothetical protein
MVTPEIAEPAESGAPAVTATDSKPASTQSPQVGNTAPALTPVVTTATSLLSEPSDPNYYAVGDLDVFPKALVKPDLNGEAAAIHASAAGKVRATVLIDEAGVVNAVRHIEAATSHIESAARELLLRTRFTPARNKEGRIVKAQVLVALDYDTRAAAPSR